jgi:hypothetical protein
MKRKFEGIDLLKLYTIGDSTKWNEMLTDCYDRSDINKLARIKYQIQVGMDDLAKKKLNTDDINTQFARWIKSIEITSKRIIKKNRPLYLDTADKGAIENCNESLKKIYLEEKQKRDTDLNDFLRKSSF